MTGIGAAAYCGFFALAALWLFTTRDPGEVIDADGDGWSAEPTATPSDNGAEPWAPSHATAGRAG